MRLGCILFASLLIATGCSTVAPTVVEPDAGPDTGTDSSRTDSGGMDGSSPWTLEGCEDGTLTVENDGEPCVGEFVCNGLCPCGAETIRCVGGVIEASGNCVDCPDGGADGAIDGGTPDVRPDSCETAIEAVASTLDIATNACTIAVRMDYTTRELLGYQSICGRYRAVDEDAARAESLEKTDWGGNLLTGTRDDTFVFYTSPGDFGGVGTVSADSGLAVFGGSIVWDGGGDITYPETWRPASQLGEGCSPIMGEIPAIGWDLRSGVALPEADVNAALTVVRQTAAPAAIWEGGYVFDATVLLYPRSVGAFDPASAEWIVLLNGGWLE